MNEQDPTSIASHDYSRKTGNAQGKTFSLNTVSQIAGQSPVYSLGFGLTNEPHAADFVLQIASSLACGMHGCMDARMRDAATRPLLPRATVSFPGFMSGMIWLPQDNGTLPDTVDS